MSFINRNKELALLEQRYQSDQAEMYVLYGRRRVGKTELLTHFCEGKRSIFYVADLDVESVLRAGLSQMVNQTLLGTDLGGAIYPTWEAILRMLGQHAQTEPLVVILDEFTYLVSAHPPLATILQRLWDSELRHTQLKLFLCGSYIGMMEDVVLGYEAPLYGRRTGQYLLEPLNFQESRLFFPNYAPDQQVLSYAVFGGTPAYLRVVANAPDLATAIRDYVLTRGTFLYDEIRFLLQQELREPRNYFAILEAIASGRTKLNEIKQATGLDGATAYLDTLQGLRLVERFVPVTEAKPHKSRRGLYRLCDPFFRFWFRFLHPNRTLLEQGGAEVALQNFVLPHLNDFTGLVWEEICRQFLWQQALSAQLPFLPTHIGGWWRKNAEIDIIALNSDTALLVECKWSTNPVGTDILQKLEAKVPQVDGLDKRQLYFGLCSRSGFTPPLLASVAERGDVLLFDLEQIVNS